MTAARTHHRPAPARRIAALVLAAGRSRRFGADNKLLAELDGQPLLVHVVNAVACTQLEPVVVVAAHAPAQLRRVLTDYDIVLAHNPNHAGGMGTSLRCGIAALPPAIDAVLVCLADMPGITADHIGRLLDAFDPARGRCIIVPTYDGTRGNPVLWDAAFIPEMSRINGDVGARQLLTTHADVVYEVEMPDQAVLIDIDTPADMEAARRKPRKAKP
ncbi:MAG: hypothetical protein BMS9Abin10_0230 [Gammaproteobacteria bacterium]|nr:MAG: hypothetical protein BMS9Abin10_0230 [Gammaproteobacteria bacterium]